MPDRRQETLRAYLARGSTAQQTTVEEVATDFWAAYHTVVAEVFPQARVVGDRFHVQHLTDAVTATRRDVQPRPRAAAAEFVRTWRDVRVRNEEDLAADAWIALAAIKSSLPEVERAQRLKEEFRAIFAAPLERTQAAKRVGGWLERVGRWAGGAGGVPRFCGALAGADPELFCAAHDQRPGGRVEQQNQAANAPSVWVWQ